MASPFQKYQSGIEASTGNLVPAYGQMAQQTISAMSNFGQSIAQGLQQYNENSAKNDILTSEAEALGQQIQMFQKQFGDSPEHAPFAQSLQPYIDQLAKVPSMSLTQKMGAVTGVKAGFANIGQQLQVFEMMRGERMKRDISAARGGVKEFDEQTVPTAIVPSGKLPYFYGKSYAENESEVVRLANQAKENGASVDLPTVLKEWRSGIKANAMSRTDLPPQVKESLLSQIDAGTGLSDNIQTDESGVTDYAKESEMYNKTSSSVKDQLAPPKVETPSSLSAQDSSIKTKELLSDTIAKLESMKGSKETISDSEFNKLVEKDPSVSRYTKVSNLESQGWKRFVDENGKVSWSKTSENKQINDALSIYKKELNKISKQEKSVENVSQDAETELKDVNSKIEELDKAIESGDTIATGTGRSLGNYFLRKMGDLSEVISKKFIKEKLISSGVNLNDPVAVRKEINRYNRGGFLDVSEGMIGGYQSIVRSSTPIGAMMKKDITVKQEKLIDSEIQREFQDSGFKLDLAKLTGDTEGQKQALQIYKTELENRVATGKINASSADLSKVQQNQKVQEQKQEPDYTLTNQYNMSLGTTTSSVATSLESKRNDMTKFFQNKYGYIPASFEESFKSIYPEANFKTMNTPYGAFMYDGKEWKQIQMKEPKVMSNKKIAEEKAVTFGASRGDGNLDFTELAPKSGVYVRGIYAGSPTEAHKFRTEMLDASNARVAVNRLMEINDMVGESMPWNAKVWGEAKALLPQIKAGLRTDIIGVGTVSNYEQQLIEEVVADPTKFWSLESSDRAKLMEIMRRVNNKLVQTPAMFGLEVKVAGQSNSEIEKNIRLGRAGKSKLELDFEARGGKKGVELNWKLSNKIPDALK